MDDQYQKELVRMWTALKHFCSVRLLMIAQENTLYLKWLAMTNTYI